MTAPPGIEQIRLLIDRSLVAADTGAVQLLPIDRRRTLELLVRRRDLGDVHAAIDRLGWRWRHGGDDVWRWGPRRVYRFDGGPSVVVHRELPCAPWPPGTLRTLRAEVLQTAAERRGLRMATPPAALTVAAVEAARDRFRSAGRLRALGELAEATGDRDAVMAFARSAGVEPLVAAALAAVEGRAVTTPSPRASATAKVVRGLARRLPGRWRALADGQPVGHAVVRCRAGGLEVLAGPGVFLPRAAGDGLVAAAIARLPEGRPVVAVEAGASCGGQLLPVLAARTRAVGTGTDIDPEAVRWASKNARRLGLPATFLCGSLFDPLPHDLLGRVDLLLANLPSIRESEFEANADAPDAAYVGTGEDGLGLHRTMAADARRWLAPGAALILQMAPWQWERFEPVLTDLGYDPEPIVDDVGSAVIAAAVWPGG